MKKRVSTTASVLAAVLVTSSVQAQSVRQTAGASTSLQTITGAPQPAAVPGASSGMPSIAPAPQISSMRPYAPSPPPAPPPVSADSYVSAADGTVTPVFGSQLFTGAFSAARPTRESSYLIQPGDQVAVRIFGAVNVDAVQTVDTGGYLFIQGVGPVKVGGSPASQLEPTVKRALSNIYTSSVGVYVDVLQGGTLGVYLTGNVRRPGRYLGSPADSVLYYLDQAGGIDPSRGTFRSVSVLRKGRKLATFDFYDFLTKGIINDFNFQEGDVIFVGRQGSLVTVTGDALNPFAFEAAPGHWTLTGREILELAASQSTVTSVGITKVARGSGEAAYFPVSAFDNVTMAAGDHVVLRSDVYTTTISVSIQGDLQTPSIFVMPRDSLLSSLLAKIPLEGTDVEPTYVHVLRPSVAQQQKAALNKALDDLQRDILTTPTLSASAGATVSTQASQLGEYIQQARQTQPSGAVAVYVGDKFNDLHLENGDVVVFPRKTDVVLVAGETLNPGGFTHADGFRVIDYVNRAGGPTSNANRKRFVLKRPDGTALVVDGRTIPRPGDQIVVVPQVISRNFLLFKDLTTVIFQMITSVAAVIAVTKN